MKIPSYTKVLTLGHRYTDPIVDGRPVRIDEKIDGSQFSAMRRNNQMYYRTRRTEIFAETSNKLFSKAVDWFEKNQISLPSNIIFRCEALMSRKHNHLEYGRAPDSGFILWDMEEFESGDILGQNERNEFCREFNIDYLNPWHIGPPGDNPVEFFRSFLDRKSILGGAIEGIVIKPIDFLAVPETAKRMAVKLVKDEYRESQPRSFRDANPTKKDIIQIIGDRYCTEARFRKAIQHLDEAGVLEGSPRDIGPLIEELGRDFEEECRNEVQELLWKWGKKNISRVAMRGFPEWYKAQLVNRLCNTE